MGQGHTADEAALSSGVCSEPCVSVLEGSADSEQHRKTEANAPRLRCTFPRGAATAWPLPLSAQKNEVRRIAVLMGIAPTEQSQACVAAFWRRLEELGWTKAVSYTHLRAHETGRNLVCRLLL